jgi:hypothetical protein
MSTSRVSGMRLSPQSFKGMVNMATFKAQTYDKLNAQGNTVGFPTSTPPQYYPGDDPRRTPKYVQIDVNSDDVLKKNERNPNLYPESRIPEIPFAMSSGSNVASVFPSGYGSLVVMFLVLIGLILVLKNRG